MPDKNETDVFRSSQIPEDPAKYEQFMKAEVRSFEKMIIRYKMVLSKLYGRAKEDLESAVRDGKDMLRSTRDRYAGENNRFARRFERPED